MLATAVSMSRSSVTAYYHLPLQHSLNQQQLPALSTTGHESNCQRMFLSSSHGSHGNDDSSEFILKKSQESDHPIIQRTLQWLKGVVIGLNFCPFAERPLLQQQLRMEVIEGTDQVDILARVLAECFLRQSQPGTSLMICPDLYPRNFPKYLEVYNMLQDGVLVQEDLTGDIQVAPFHPEFVFGKEGQEDDYSDDDGIENYTNRSPYPIFHILREEEVAHAVDVLQGDDSKVWKRNIRLLQLLEAKLSNEHLDQVLAGTVQDNSELATKVKDILWQLKNNKNF